jgi:hypothetical protein
MERRAGKRKRVIILKLKRRVGKDQMGNKTRGGGSVVYLAGEGDEAHAVAKHLVRQR